MVVGDSSSRWEAELVALRQELSELRVEQQQMAKAIRELVQTFRALAMHLGIAAEPYTKGEKDPRSGKEIAGFG